MEPMGNKAQSLHGLSVEPLFSGFGPSGASGQGGQECKVWRALIIRIGFL